MQLLASLTPNERPWPNLPKCRELHDDWQDVVTCNAWRLEEMPKHANPSYRGARPVFVMEGPC